MELKGKVVALGLGAALLAFAGVLAFFGFGFALAAIVAALAIPLPVSAALGIVVGGLFGLAGLAALIGIGRLKKGSPPVPEQAIREAKLTTEALRSNGK